MNNSDLIDTVATAHDLSKADAKKIIDGVISAIVDAAAKGEEISLNGFGKFKVKESAAREGRQEAGLHRCQGGQGQAERLIQNAI